MPTEKLEPCGCGGDAVYHNDLIQRSSPAFYAGAHWYDCSMCEVGTKFHPTKEAAAATWNRCMNRRALAPAANATPNLVSNAAAHVSDAQRRARIDEIFKLPAPSLTPAVAREVCARVCDERARQWRTRSGVKWPELADENEAIASVIRALPDEAFTASRTDAAEGS